ncbi:hypothetical protein BY996DRAFT_8171214 [Phakopsora pachyrhizi]|nr:hypothetical protein BY996DRAFT_8171214 [Phakopsora pachyrhizi]
MPAPSIFRQLLLFILLYFFFIYISKNQMRVCLFLVLSGSFFIFFLYLYFKKSNESLPAPSIVRQLLLFFCYIFSLFIFQKIK